MLDSLRFSGKRDLFWDFDPRNYTGLPTSAIVKIVKCRRANAQKDTTSPAFIPRVTLECESFIFVGAPP